MPSGPSPCLFDPIPIPPPPSWGEYKTRVTYFVVGFFALLVIVYPLQKGSMEWVGSPKRGIIIFPTKKSAIFNKKSSLQMDG